LKKPTLIAHRGGREWAPENTLIAFRKSLEFGVDGIELDVHRCSSGELVVIHDEDLARTTNGAGLVKDASLAELKRLDAGKWYDKEFAGERIPTLQEVLDLIAGKVVLNIEIKNTPVDYPDIEDDLLDLIENYPNRDSLIVSSFDHQFVRRLHGKAPDLKVALLAAGLFVDLGEYAAKLGAKYYHPALDCIRGETVQEAHDAGLIVNVWTANSRREWTDAIAFGVDGIVTDDPEGLRQFLELSLGSRVS
jgi:glycerophosphoryl diester phosphodiesterase